MSSGVSRIGGKQVLVDAHCRYARFAVCASNTCVMRGSERGAQKSVLTDGRVLSTADVPLLIAVHRCTCTE